MGLAEVSPHSPSQSTSSDGLFQLRLTRSSIHDVPWQSALRCRHDGNTHCSTSNCRSLGYARPLLRHPASLCFHVGTEEDVWIKDFLGISHSSFGGYFQLGWHEQQKIPCWIHATFLNGGYQGHQSCPNIFSDGFNSHCSCQVSRYVDLTSRFLSISPTAGPLLIVLASKKNSCLLSMKRLEAFIAQHTITAWGHCLENNACILLCII